MAKIAYLIRRLIHFVRPVHYVGPALPRRVSLESGGTAEVFSGNANWVSLESGDYRRSL